uniref:Uncharacterized protein n=1 Tax=Rhizophora mucronata TaxID=61149 RepID=A0A2P2PBI4_RHIMU
MSFAYHIVFFPLFPFHFLYLDSTPDDLFVFI